MIRFGRHETLGRQRSVGTESEAADRRSAVRFFLTLFGLCLPIWTIGAFVDVELFPGFKLFQAGLAMPMTAALILSFRAQGSAGVAAMLRRTYDVRCVSPRSWFVPMVLLFPSFGLINYLIFRVAGAELPPPTFSLAGLFGYCTVFFMAMAEEVGLTAYAADPMLARHSALTTGVVLGLVWAGYHIPGFVISGYYTADWILWHAAYTVAARILFIWIYNNSGRSLFSMALCHWTFGLFWMFWPQDNLQKAVPFYDPRITAVAATGCVLLVVYFWGAKTMRQFRFARREQTL